MELSREQVEKALECCGNRVKADCANCPMDEKRGCAIELYSKALAVIRELIKILEGAE